MGCEEPIFYMTDLKPPFDLISWANIVNVYPLTKLNLVLEMSLKKANCRLYATLEEAQEAYWEFCWQHHKAEAHECFSAFTWPPPIAL
ncbi:hypothetical protein BDN71DRAFT_1514152 [Pleurotus eryngii]|uniref:Uncharacterized protein n=1 Tax=Pleurotus eryngii TaxID=5323 RepID=A0A9P5ZJ15_PLEER|nr:hypothetical protein BDN71DRAFT_1514152 [Pleurotus eryngii]